MRVRNEGSIIYLHCLIVCLLRVTPPILFLFLVPLASIPRFAVEEDWLLSSVLHIVDL